MSETVNTTSDTLRIQKQKETLRQLIRKEKAARSSRQLAEMSRQITGLLEHDAHFVAAKTVLMYCALPDEVGTRGFLDRWYRHKTLLLPRVSADDLTLHVYEGPNSLSVGAYHIQEPTTPEFLQYHEIELAVVPGMAFDKAGHRLGRGRGYYDRLLPRLTCENLYLIGLAFPFQIVPHIPVEAHDVRLDHVITLENEKIF